MAFFFLHSAMHVPLKDPRYSPVNAPFCFSCDCVQQIAAGLGFDMASLINNPAFISMVRVTLNTVHYKAGC